MASSALTVVSSKDAVFVARTAYSLAAVLMLLPLADIGLGLLPLQFDNLRWRIGVTGMTTGALLLPITGLFVVICTAHLRGHQRVRATFAALAILAGVILLAASVMFTLDTLQLRGEVDVRGRHLYDRAAVKGIASQLITAAILLMTGITSFRTAKATRPGRTRPEPTAGPVVGRPDVVTGRSS